MEVDDNAAENMTILRNDMINSLVLNTDIVFKSQQLGEPDLTCEEKRAIVQDCLNNKPLNFLSRFSRFMKKPHFEYFRHIHPELEYEVAYYLQECSTRKPETVVRNRRLEALKRLAVEGDYFTEEEMRKRNPLLYEQLVGKYLTEEEKKDKNSFSRTMKKEDGCKLSSLLMEQFERDMAEDLKKKQEDAEEEIETGSEDDFPEEMEEDDRVLHLWGESNSACNYIDVSERISEGEKRLLFEEFRSQMYRDFIGGKENDFDYSNVDTNAEYDDLDELGRDAEDKYFSSESPEDVEMELAETTDPPDRLQATSKPDLPASQNGNSTVELQLTEPCDERQPASVESTLPSLTRRNPLEDDPLDLFMSQLQEEQTHLQLNSQLKNTVI